MNTLKTNLRLIKCHYSFCFTKKTIILISLLFSISLIYNFISLNSLIDSPSSISEKESYIESTISFTSLIVTFFSNIVFSYSFLSKQDSYLAYIITGKINKTNYYITKIITIILVIMVFMIFEIVSFFVPFIFHKNIYVELGDLLIFLELLKIVIYYGFFSLILVILFDNMYVILLPLVLYIFSTNINVLDKFILKIISFFIPIVDEGFRLINNNGIMFCLIISLFVISIFIYTNRD